mgnify:CR=1 FL=1
MDGLGARVSENSWGFYCVLTLGNAVIAIIFLIITSPKTLIDVYRKGFSTFVIGGGASFLAYGIVTWAFTQSPIAVVTALRETSIVFALLIGIIFLLIQGISELFKSYWAAKKGVWPGEKK